MNNDYIYTIASQQDLEKAQMDIEEFNKIIDDYSQLFPKLKKTIAFHADLIQDHLDVNAIKYRIKTPKSLGQKIIRKRIEAIENSNNDSKYMAISVKNYKKVITDLMGMRVIYLFKHYWKSVNNHILDNLKMSKKEPIVIYYVELDDMSFYFKDDFSYDGEVYSYKHDASKSTGYRSTHYPAIDPINNIQFEIQTRSIFEDSWSEIDHELRYPHNTSNINLNDEMHQLNSMVDKCQERATKAFDIHGKQMIEEVSQTQTSKPDILTVVKTPTALDFSLPANTYFMESEKDRVRAAMIKKNFDMTNALHYQEWSKNHLEGLGDLVSKSINTDKWNRYKGAMKIIESHPSIKSILNAYPSALKELENSSVISSLQTWEKENSLVLENANMMAALTPDKIKKEQ